MSTPNLNSLITNMGRASSDPIQACGFNGCTVSQWILGWSFSSIVDGAGETIVLGEPMFYPVARSGAMLYTGYTGKHPPKKPVPPPFSRWIDGKGYALDDIHTTSVFSALYAIISNRITPCYTQASMWGGTDVPISFGVVRLPQLPSFTRDGLPPGNWAVILALPYNMPGTLFNNLWWPSRNLSGPDGPTNDPSFYAPPGEPIVFTLPTDVGKISDALAVTVNGAPPPGGVSWTILPSGGDYPDNANIPGGGDGCGNVVSFLFGLGGAGNATFDPATGIANPGPNPSPDADTWLPLHNYSLGDAVVDKNGNLQSVKTAGISGATEPAGMFDPPPNWSFIDGTDTDDGTVVWTCTDRWWCDPVPVQTVSTYDYEAYNQWFAIAVFTVPPGKTGKIVFRPTPALPDYVVALYTDVCGCLFMEPSTVL